MARRHDGGGGRLCGDDGASGDDAASDGPRYSNSGGVDGSCPSGALSASSTSLHDTQTHVSFFVNGVHADKITSHASLGLTASAAAAFTHTRVDGKSTNNLGTFLQRAQTICSHCKRCISYGNSVRLSVRLSDTRRYCVKTTACSTVQCAPLDSKMCLVL